MKEKHGTNSKTMAVTVLVILQLCYMLYWGSQKSGYYVDEFFTYDNTHYISSSTPGRIKLYDADFLTYDEWHKVSDLKGTLTVKRDESLLADSPAYNIKMLLNKGVYRVLLNYTEAIFFENKLSIWGALSLNLVFFLMTQVLLYKLVSKLTGNWNIAILATAVYGFSGMAVSMFVYVRFYTLVTFLMVLYLYLHILMWEGAGNIRKSTIYEVLSLPVLYLAYKDSPLAGIYGIGIAGFFLVGLLIKKRYLQAVIYAVPVLGGGLLYALFKTNYVRFLLNPAKSMAEAGAAESALLGNLISLTPQTGIERMIGLSHIVCRYLFGHAAILGVYFALAVVLAVLAVTKRKREVSTGGKTVYLDTLLLLLLPCVFYGIASICFNLGFIRYNSVMFPALAAILAAIIIWLREKAGYGRVVRTIVLAAVIGEIIFTSSIPRIENIYLEDREGVAKIKEFKGINSVVVDCGFDDRIMYECLAYTDESTNVMFTDSNSISSGDYGSEVLVWFRADPDPGVVDDILEAGYGYMEEVASTHESAVYLVKK